ncbi:tRNA pseudouridine synthase-like 1 isoform X2 [Argiope bruennichi]|uniref:tRNA pseudouridine synthase-like 1 isoform X2 n=1 Tax=Argiope bruennichi TaxID=94029 RepID=UPI00249537CC|nr:tRNA pseudouridine synthase-like 1 isoform X2 [Argiope bruennichi]
MVRYLLRLGYIGTKYSGTQKQINVPESKTVQNVVESALLKLRAENIPTTFFASRTDKGVHALMNALHVDLDHKKADEFYQPHNIKRVLNSYFIENDHEIVVTNACVVPDEFHARFHAKWRSYYYRIAILKPGLDNIVLNHCQGYLPICEINRCYAVPSELNTSIVKNVADMYCGEHDFSTFTKYIGRTPWKSTVRLIEECKFYESSYPNFIDDPQYSNISIWEFYIKSQSFLYHQVRKLVGTAVAAGLGRISLHDVKHMFEAPNPENWIKCHLPPAGGLYLAHIHYDKKDFLMNDLSSHDRIDKEETICSQM